MSIINPTFVKSTNKCKAFGGIEYIMYSSDVANTGKKQMEASFFSYSPVPYKRTVHPFAGC